MTPSHAYARLMALSYVLRRERMNASRWQRHDWPGLRERVRKGKELVAMDG